jgi:hypothetical protein
MFPLEIPALTRWSRVLLLLQAIGCASGPSFFSL